MALPRVLALSIDFWVLARNMLLPSVPIMILLFIIIQLEWLANQRKTLGEREKERQIYISQVLKAQEDERRRISRELHDDSLQTLLAVANRAQGLARDGWRKSATAAREDALWIRDTTLGVSESMRRMSHDLRPSILDDIGLVPALKWLVNRMNRESDINTQISVSGEGQQLGSEFDVNIFRITQEALNNIKRHSGASKAWVNVDFTQGSLQITIRDNGKGFSLPKSRGAFAASSKLGLDGIRERAKLLGATFDIQSEPGGGTTLRFEAKILTGE